CCPPKAGEPGLCAPSALLRIGAEEWRTPTHQQISPRAVQKRIYEVLESVKAVRTLRDCPLRCGLYNPAAAAGPRKNFAVLSRPPIAQSFTEEHPHRARNPCAKGKGTPRKPPRPARP